MIYGAGGDGIERICHGIVLIGKDEGRGGLFWTSGTRFGDLGLWKR